MAYQDDDSNYVPFNMSDDQSPSQALVGLMSPADADSLVPANPTPAIPIESGNPAPNNAPASPSSVAAMPVSGRAALAAMGPPPQFDEARMGQLEQQRDTDATPLNPRATQYRPGLGTKILRGLGGYFTGGLGGALLTNYSAPNRQYQTDEAARQARLGQDTSQIADLEKNYEDELKGYQRGTDYLKERRLADTADQNYRQQLAKNGLMQQQNPDGTSAVVPDPDSPVYKRQQAQNDYFTARKEYENAMANLANVRADAAGNPKSPAFQLAIRRANIAAQNAQTAAGRLGLSGQEFAFNQEKFYNPQPTSTERQKGDLAQSALERVQEMKAIIAKRPDIFGPGAGRATKAQQWLGSQDPDAQTYQSAAEYLADHSAGVFGGRGKYIIESLHSLTDPHYNPGALNAALDEADRTARGFATAGTVHHGPQGNQGALSPGPMRHLDRQTAAHFLQLAGGDPMKARQLAAQQGYKF